MIDLMAEVSDIAERMQKLQNHARDIEAHRILGKLRDAAVEVGNAWCRSWFGYHANVYYRYFDTPSNQAFFD